MWKYQTVSGHKFVKTCRAKLFDGAVSNAIQAWTFIIVKGLDSSLHFDHCVFGFRVRPKRIGNCCSKWFAVIVALSTSEKIRFLLGSKGLLRQRRPPTARKSFQKLPDSSLACWMGVPAASFGFPVLAVGADQDLQLVGTSAISSDRHSSPRGRSSHTPIKAIGTQSLLSANLTRSMRRIIFCGEGWPKQVPRTGKWSDDSSKTVWSCREALNW